MKYVAPTLQFPLAAVTVMKNYYYYQTSLIFQCQSNEQKIKYLRPPRNESAKMAGDARGLLFYHKNSNNVLQLIREKDQWGNSTLSLPLVLENNAEAGMRTGA